MSDYFIIGEYIGLRSPDIEQDIYHGEWANWFNDESVTRYLVHGVYPNSIESQVAYIKSKLASDRSIVLAIDDINTGEMIGVISLDSIDLINRLADIAIVIGAKKYPCCAPIEAMGLMTQHAFEKLNLTKVQAGQHVGLWKWVNTLELIGYRLEGYILDTHKRNFKSYDSVRVGITRERYLELLRSRGGAYFGEDIRSLLKTRRKENMCEVLGKMIRELYELPTQV